MPSPLPMAVQAGEASDLPVSFSAADLLGSPSIFPVARKECERLFGSNSVEIEVPNVFILLYKEVLTPFYIFQAAAILVFYFEDYYYYALCIFLLSVVSAATSLYETRRNLVNLRKISSYTGTINVVQASYPLPDHMDANTISLDTRELVPGDIVVVEASPDPFPCDAVLIEGSCLINESMLTGKSQLKPFLHCVHSPLNQCSPAFPLPEHAGLTRQASLSL